MPWYSQQFLTSLHGSTSLLSRLCRLLFLFPFPFLPFSAPSKALRLCSAAWENLLRVKLRDVVRDSLVMNIEGQLKALNSVSICLRM